MSGVLGGIVIGAVTIVVGGLLTATVIGAILGIPLILFGIVAIVISPFQGGIMGLMAKKGKCPYCQNELTFVYQKALTCKYCKKRLLVKNKQLSLVE